MAGRQVLRCRHSVRPTPLGPHRKWGPALLPAPTAPSEGSAGVRNLVKTREGPDPLSILAHQLRRRFRSNSSLVRGAKPAYQTARPEGSLVLRPVRPVMYPIREPTSRRKPSDVLRPFLGNTLLRPASLTRSQNLPKETRGPRNRVARQKDFSSGASYQLTPKRTRKFFLLPAGGDRTFGHLPLFPAVAGFLERPGPPSRSPTHHAHLSRVAKAKNGCSSLWITGISGTTGGTFSTGRHRFASVAVPFPAAYSRQVPESPAINPDPSYLEGLNPPQREAVLTTDGPVLVLAGAGTGKTAALTARLAHLIATRRAWPSEILAVTFTNKAARAMKDRVSAISGGAIEGMPWLGTFHSVAARMLRSHAELVGLQSNFTILDTDDQLRVLKQLISAANLDEKRWPARQLAGLIDRWKNRGWTPAQVDAGESAAFAAGRGAELYAQYQERLKTLNACDFGDLLLHMLVIFRTHPDVLEAYRDRFRYLLVDEYQDTNSGQYEWLRLLAEPRRNICCVGDDDQSIYSWRGAEVANLLRFEKDFPGAKIIRLEQNYRSTS